MKRQKFFYQSSNIRIPPRFALWENIFLMESLLTSVSTGYREISTSSLISRPVACILISQFMQASGAKSSRYSVAWYTVWCQMGSLGYLMRIFRLR